MTATDRSHMTAVTVQAGRHRYELHAPPGDHIGDAIRTSGAPYERDLLRALAPFVSPQSVVVDVGANIGNHSLYFAITRGAIVHAFEPNPDSRHYLRENLDANRVKHVVIHSEALSDEPGTASLVESDDLGTVSLARDPAGAVRVARLDDFRFPPELRIAVLKVDVEGCEAAILEGADRTLAVHRPLIAVEAPMRSDRARVAAALPDGYRRLPIRFGWTSTYVYYPHLRYLPPLLAATVYAKASQFGPWKRRTLGGSGGSRART